MPPAMNGDIFHFLPMWSVSIKVLRPYAEASIAIAGLGGQECTGTT